MSAPLPYATSDEELSLIREIAGDIAFALFGLETQAAREASEATYRALVEQIPAITYTAALDETSTTTYISPQVKTVLGYTPEEYSADPDFWWKHVHDDDRERVLTEVARSHATGEPFISEYRMIAKDGHAVWLRDEARLVLDERGVPVHLQGVMHDVTESRRAVEDRLRLEAELRQSQKLESIGQLAGGVAHDFNNILTVMLGYCELEMAKLAEGDPLRESFAHVRACGERAAQLTRQLLAFSRKQTLRPEVVDLNSVVGSLAGMLGRLIGEDIDLRTVLADGLWSVEADPGQIGQVIMNLAVNARDAMPNGGTLTVETSNVESGAADVQRRGRLAPGRYVLLSMTDSGCGMSRETREKLFEPFFTTKEQGRGTGLGLSTVYGIVKQSGGDIVVDSEVGKGSTFRIYLPMTQARASAAAGAPAPAAAERRGNGEHVLVVEDELALHGLLKRMLEELGYRATIAANGGEALLLMEEEKLRPDIVITDVVMPGMSGPVLVERLRRARPDLKVLYMSGYFGGAIVPQNVLTPGTPYIQKPFTGKDLAAKIAGVIAGK